MLDTFDTTSRSLIIWLKTKSKQMQQTEKKKNIYMGNVK